MTSRPTGPSGDSGSCDLEPYYTDGVVTLHNGDALAVLSALPSGSVDCCVTSPPYYGLRDYGTEGQYGLEPHPDDYVHRMRRLFDEVKRVLTDEGTLWLNIGDSYSGGQRATYDTNGGKTRARGHAESRPQTGLPEKNLLGIPWQVAFALQKGGWTLRNAIVWHKPNAMPESVTDRLSSRYELVFLFAQMRSYDFDLNAIREPTTTTHASTPAAAWRDGALGHAGATSILHQGWRPGDSPDGRNPGDVWAIPTQPFSAAHFACMPRSLAERCIKAGCKPGGIVLDPFSGSGTTGLAATRLGRRYVGIDLNRDYLDLSLRTRLAQTALVDEESA